MVSAKKIKFVQEVGKLLREYPIIGVINLENLPAPQFQTMRSSLRNDGVILAVGRKRLLHRALDQIQKPGMDQLKEKLRGMPALLFSKGNPFALYSKIEKSKSEAPAKAGQTAPKDIMVKAGVTNFAPGPIISELAAVGIKTKVENGKLSIIADVKVAKEGDQISGKLAETLKRLDIKPMEIGLNVVAVWEGGVTFTAKQLRIDEQEYTNQFTQAAQWAFNLAIEAAYPCAETTETLLQKAFHEAKGLALEQEILTDATTGDLMAKAERQALSLKAAAKIDTLSEKSE